MPFATRYNSFQLCVFGPFQDTDPGRVVVSFPYCIGVEWAALWVGSIAAAH